MGTSHVGGRRHEAATAQRVSRWQGHENALLGRPLLSTQKRGPSAGQWTWTHFVSAEELTEVLPTCRGGEMPKRLLRCARPGGVPLSQQPGTCFTHLFSLGLSQRCRMAAISHTVVQRRKLSHREMGSRRGIRRPGDHGARVRTPVASVA